MKRLHINLAVSNLEQSIRFYSSLFASPPFVVKEDYAKWMLEDPHVNFSLTTHGAGKGVDHLGIQVETSADLVKIRDRLHSAGQPLLEQGETVCCYAQSEKNWTRDPDGVAWETFLTKGESPSYDGSALTLEGDPAVYCEQATTQTSEQAQAGCCRPEIGERQ